MMATAIAVYSSDGCEGRCDARCHDATTPDCDCICGGRLHGVGAANAIAENTRLLFADDQHHENLLAAFADAHGLDGGHLKIEVAADQTALLTEASDA